MSHFNDAFAYPPHPFESYYRRPTGSGQAQPPFGPSLNPEPTGSSSDKVIESIKIPDNQQDQDEHNEEAEEEEEDADMNHILPKLN